jgi:hypothetical protein
MELTNVEAEEAISHGCDLMQKFKKLISDAEITEELLALAWMENYYIDHYTETCSVYASECRKMDLSELSACGHSGNGKINTKSSAAAAELCFRFSRMIDIAAPHGFGNANAKEAGQKKSKTQK